MSFFKFILKYGKKTLIYSVIVGLVSGFGLSGMMAVIHRTLDGNADTVNYYKLLLAFVLLWLIYGGLCILSEFLLIRLSEKIAFQLKLALSHQIFTKELRELEKIGTHRLFAILVEDITSITSFVGRLPNAFINIAIVFGCYGYMLWLSPPLFLFNICFLMVAILLFKIPSNLAKRFLAKSREITDDMIKQYRSLAEGLKELFLHHRKRQDFLTLHLHATDRALMNQNISAKSIYVISQRFGDLLILANIGCLLFLVPIFFEVKPHLLTGFILAALFSLSPLATLLSFIPQWMNVNVALEKIQTYGFDLFNTDSERSENAPLKESPQRGSYKLKLEDIKFEYKDELNGDRFVVGPINFQVQSGELTFIVGGNGTGKTTLAKVICGLYLPEEGLILWNNEPVDNFNRETFLQNFSVVFSDYHLFKYLIGIDPEEIENHAENYLKTLNLHEKVHIRNGGFSTVDLSYGQQKRLALLASCLEDRPVYIFDEWAAGQDPVFKKEFYEKILIDLKRKNKVVLVITHDDRYFSVADRVIRLDDGKIVST